MFKRILALIWLRTQVLLTNKNTLVQVVFPFFMVLLFQNFMNTDGTQGKTLLFSSLTMAFSFSSGSMISNSIAEEKEKRIFKTLILSGVRRGEYLVSVLFYPVIFALASVISFPIMVEVDFACIPCSSFSGSIMYNPLKSSDWSYFRDTNSGSGLWFDSNAWSLILADVFSS